MGWSQRCFREKIQKGDRETESPTCLSTKHALLVSSEEITELFPSTQTSWHQLSVVLLLPPTWYGTWYISFSVFHSNYSLLCKTVIFYHSLSIWKLCFLVNSKQCWASGQSTGQKRKTWTKNKVVNSQSHQGIPVETKDKKKQVFTSVSWTVMLYHIMGRGEIYSNKKAVHCQKLLRHEDMLFSSENHKTTIPISHKYHSTGALYLWWSLGTCYSLFSSPPQNLMSDPFALSMVCWHNSLLKKKEAIDHYPAPTVSRRP